MGLSYGASVSAPLKTRSRWGTALALVGGLLLLATTNAACGKVGKTRSVQAPAADGVKHLITALRAADPRPAYALLSAKARSKVDYATFAKRWKTTAAERKHQAAALEEGLKTDPNVGERSRVVYPDGQAIHLLREGNAWRLEAALVSKHHAGRAEDAVRLFAKALRGLSTTSVLQLLTTRRRKALSKRLERFVTSLNANQNTPVEYIGKDRAELHWEDEENQYRLVLLREGDAWRVDDIDIRHAPVQPKKNGLRLPPRRR